jgi:hypothetical protein
MTETNVHESTTSEKGLMNPVFCPLCGTPMKETYRMQHEGLLWIFLECSRLECDGKVTRKGMSGFLQDGPLTFSTQDS